MGCEPMVNDKNEVVGFICSIGGHQAKNNKLYLLDEDLEVIGEPKNTFDVGDCGEWEYHIKCPKCGQPAKAKSGYGFMHDHAVIDCKECSYYMDTQRKEKLDRLKHVKKVFSKFHAINYQEGQLNDEQIEKLYDLCWTVEKHMRKIGIYYIEKDDVMRAFRLLYHEHYHRHIKIRRHLKSVIKR